MFKIIFHWEEDIGCAEEGALIEVKKSFVKVSYVLSYFRATLHSTCFGKLTHILYIPMLLKSPSHLELVVNCFENLKWISKRVNFYGTTGQQLMILQNNILKKHLYMESLPRMFIFNFAEYFRADILHCTLAIVSDVFF